MISDRMKKEIARDAADYQAARAKGRPARERRKLWQSVFDAVLAALNVIEGLVQAEHGRPIPIPSAN
jgi:hypothetical protein